MGSAFLRLLPWRISGGLGDEKRIIVVGASSSFRRQCRFILMLNNIVGTICDSDSFLTIFPSFASV